eukprot:TRINITY_DN59798_c0_g1_i1.p1 TRINITY_DN59798_c0_g1~~TRINITY_DN59798_c0_g1_i1.p1  ORF type:complete len:340 (-),score=45.13 TRINITY_DN59798_c0_g1_i1:15-1034(-)
MQMYGGMQYGGMPNGAPLGKQVQAMSVKNFGLRRYRRMNICAVLLSLFVPWIVFCAVLALFTSKYQYLKPGLVSGTGASVVGVLAALWLLEVGRRIMAACTSEQNRQADMEAYGQGRKEHNDPRQGRWYPFLLTTMLLGSIAAIYIGRASFITNMEPYYNVQNLNSYTSIDPATTSGQELMDGGQVLFAENTTLDRSRFVGFKNEKTYCVAPIAKSNVAMLSNYDFWAVGMNCCGDGSPTSEFTCGQATNIRARAGVRAMTEDDRPFYRLAVQQAMSTYNIRSNHPLFFTWTEDPAAQVQGYMMAGYKQFVTAMYSHFAIQLLLVCIASFIFVDSPSLA